jgi:hypothetical protein
MWWYGSTMVRKVVINRKYGGFGLSNEAMELLAEKKGISITAKKYGYEIIRDGKETGEIFYERNFKRDDPDLVSVVELLGERANDCYSRLEVVEIPEDVSWYISDYDGMERVEEQHRSWPNKGYYDE